MEASTNTIGSLTATPLTVGTPMLELSDAELLSATRRLVGRSNQLLASLLAHLAEVEARGIHRVRACASLYTYCIYELRFSEDEAFRRVSAARLVRRFPALLDAIATGELHLTGVLMLGPHLTPDNLLEVLALAKHRTKKELARLVRRLDPLPEVSSRIEPLGPAPSRLVSPAPTWSQAVDALNPVRELEPGARPRDWMNSTQSAASANDGSGATRLDNGASAGEHALADEDEDRGERPAEVVRGRLEHQRYKVQFEASEEYVELIEKAKGLLSHAAPRPDLGDLHLRAMRALVAELERKKYAMATRQRFARGSAPKTADEQAVKEASESDPKPDRQSEPEPESESESELEPKSEPEPEPEQESKSESSCPRRRGRHIPAAIRRAVVERDAGRCTYRSDSGERCRETARLELHHSIAFAQGGAHRLDNVTLRCRAHNALAAEDDFGRHFVASARGSSQHELWARHEATCALPPNGVR
jgi:hypothetical protein